MKRKVAGGLVAATLLLGGCHTDMWVQHKVHKPMQPSPMFSDGSSARHPVPGTVAQGNLREDVVLATGRQSNGDLVPQNPLPVTRELLLRGQERYTIYCSPCHGAVGDGLGMIAQRGLSLRREPANYHTDRLRNIADGHIYDVITRGYGVMFSYANRIEPNDRWAIVAYVRALQLSQNAPIGQLDAQDQQAIQAAPPQPATGEADPTRRIGTPDQTAPSGIRQQEGQPGQEPQP
jgi:mono/diheme cytochrome c family protein